MDHPIEAVFEITNVGALIVLAAHPSIPDGVKLNGVLKQPDGGERPVQAQYMFVSGPNVDRTRISFSLAGLHKADVPDGSSIWFADGPAG